MYRSFAKHLHLTLLSAKLWTSLHVFPHFRASSTAVLFQVCFGLLLLLAPFWFQSNACFFNGFTPFPHGMTHQSPFPLSNSHYYRFLSGTSHSSVLLFILGHLMLIILRKRRFTNICNLFAICIIIFHAPHPYNSTELTWILNIRILVFISIFILTQCVQFHEDPICPLDPCFSILECSSVCRTALLTHVTCSTLKW